MLANASLRVAVIGDIHAHEIPVGQFRDLFQRLSEHSDLLILCGDVTNTGSAAEAKALAADLRQLRIPAIGVLGNHDYHSGHVDEVRSILRDAEFTFLDEEPFEFRGVGFVGVKGFGGGFTKFMLASFGEEAIKAFVAEAVNESLKLENLLQRLNTERTVVVLHYAPIPETVHGEPPEIFPFLGSSRLAETIERFEIAAVFHGHAHHGTALGKTAKGIPVYNCSLDLMRRLNPEQPYRLWEIEVSPEGVAEQMALPGAGAGEK